MMDQKVLQSYVHAFDELAQKNAQAVNKDKTHAERSAYTELKRSFVERYHRYIEQEYDADRLLSEISKDYELLSPYWNK